MTDRLECPDCGGQGYQRLGPLGFWCRFCAGHGYVGDDNEPAHRDAEVSEPVDPMALPPVWEEPAAKGMPGCQQCLGSGQVISLGGRVRGGTASRGVVGPCPTCGGP